MTISSFNPTLNKALASFHEMIVAAGKLPNKLQNDDDPYFRDDWLQANWELIVEGKLMVEGFKGHLEAYGNGADLNGESSRVTFPDRSASHHVVCRARDLIQDRLSDEKFDLTVIIAVFDRFVSWNDRIGFYEERAPYDSILALVDDKEVVLDLASITFDLMDLYE